MGTGSTAKSPIRHLIAESAGRRSSRLRVPGGVGPFAGRGVFPASPRSPPAVWILLGEPYHAALLWFGEPRCGIKSMGMGAIRVQPSPRENAYRSHEPVTHRGHSNRLPFTIRCSGPARGAGYPGRHSATPGRAWRRSSGVPCRNPSVFLTDEDEADISLRPPHSRRDQPSPQFCAAENVPVSPMRRAYIVLTSPTISRPEPTAARSARRLSRCG